MEWTLHGERRFFEVNDRLEKEGEREDKWGEMDGRRKLGVN